MSANKLFFGDVEEGDEVCYWSDYEELLERLEEVKDKYDTIAEAVTDIWRGI